MKNKITLFWFGFLLLISPLLTAQKENSIKPSASHGGTAKLIQEEPLDPKNDFINQFVEENTVNSLIVSFTIDNNVITLNSAITARAPKKSANRDGKNLTGDVVIVTGFSNGQEVARTVIPDSLRNIQEDKGLVLTKRRQLTAVLAADTPIKRVSIEAKSTDAQAILITKKAYDWICKAEPKSKWCDSKK